MAKKLDEKKAERRKGGQSGELPGCKLVEQARSRGEEAREGAQEAKMGMQALQFRSSFILAVIMIGLMSYLNSQYYYEGHVVAKLPFVPFSFIGASVTGI